MAAQPPDLLAQHDDGAAAFGVSESLEFQKPKAVL